MHGKDEMAEIEKTRREARATRRHFGRLLAGFGLAVGLSACAGLKGRPRDPNRKPFWEREEQRDD